VKEVLPLPTVVFKGMPCATRSRETPGEEQERRESGTED